MSTGIFTIISETTDVYANLAKESAILYWLSGQAELEKSIYGLFLWQSNNTIVFGRNQNIEKECDLNFVNKNGIILARRDSGGGAVYQDLGNLNFTFFSTEDINDRSRNFAIILDALSKIGVIAEVSGRNDITVDDRKVSGNAFRHFKHADLHHGTLLINEDINLAEKCLTPEQYKLKKKGINSVHSRIRNISDVCPEVNMDIAIKAIVAAFCNAFIEAEKILPELDDAEYEKNYERFKSDEWIFRIDFSFENKIEGDWGTFSYRIIETDGAIHEIQYESDLLDVELLDSVIDQFKGLQLDVSTVKVLKQYNVKNDAVNIVYHTILEDLEAHLIG